jgi:hypothetical protein
MQTPEELVTEVRARPVEEMSPEEVDLLVEQLHEGISRCNRMCNLLLNRPRGLSVHAIQVLDNLKSDFSWLRWHIENHRLPDAGA